MLLFEEVMSKDFPSLHSHFLEERKLEVYYFTSYAFPPICRYPFESTGLKQLFIVSCESAEQVIYFAFIFQWSSP